MPSIKLFPLAVTATEINYSTCNLISKQGMERYQWKNHLIVTMTVWLLWITSLSLPSLIVSLASHLLFLLPFNGAIVQLLCKNNSSLFVTLQYQQHEIHDCTWSIPPCLLAPKNEKETVKWVPGFNNIAISQSVSQDQTARQLEEEEEKAAVIVDRWEGRPLGHYLLHDCAARWWTRPSH